MATPTATSSRDLRSICMFSSCRPAVLSRIQRSSDVVSVVAGGTVQRDLQLRWAYAVLDGSLAAQCTDHVCIASPGDIVGLRAALHGQTPRLTLTALIDTTLLVTPHRSLLGLLESTGLGLLAAQELLRNQICA